MEILIDFFSDPFLIGAGVLLGVIFGIMYFVIVDKDDFF
jgi:hypothetical protein